MTRSARSGRYAPLVAYVLAQPDQAVTLSFAQIETIIAGELSVTAQVSPAFWVSEDAGLFVRDLRAGGGRI